ncbi:MAG: hypothetical protein P9M03_10555 [Candidatus Theseobacter exili]|nr:hypothetical protein [Candidatus Theseobacter exili]
MTFNWNEDKNIYFEEIVLCLSEGKVHTILDHPNKEKYKNQKLYIIEYKNNIYVVPFVTNDIDEEIFLKTIYPSREYSKRYLHQEEEK